MQSRNFHPGMGQAVAERTILRKCADGNWETWAEVAHRVALGNSLLCETKEEQEREYKILHRHLLKATTLMSGRHLQHGDETQPTRNMEVMTNCATSCTSFALFYLLMNGSGVGRCYDDDIMLTDWDNSPTVRCVLDESHPDFDYSAHESVRDAKHKYGNGKGVVWVHVEDTREGWAKGLEIWEVMTFEKIHKDKMLILDFSKVRPKGSPIRGMQNRPASGPVPLMNAFNKAFTLKGAGLAKWMQAIYIDHYFAECVLVGGARRAARMSTKSWRDPSVLEFITVKRPIEFIDKSVEEILKIRHRSLVKPSTFLWSSNNSVTVDAEFWRLLALKKGQPKFKSLLAKHARAVFKLVTSAAYADGTGEPGFINQDKLNQSRKGLDLFDPYDWVGSKKYQIEEDTQLYLNRLFRSAMRKPSFMICNPCGEISISLYGAYCTIADLVPYHADTLDEAEEAFRAVTRALIRVNSMDSLYQHEVKRTNRIGVGMTGVHEFAWKFFKLGFHDLLDEDKSRDFWEAIARFKRAVQDEARSYALARGMAIPHTDTTIKPAGTVSKLFGLTEGWHLPAMEFYLRWVQFSINDPLVAKYRKNGYPCRELKKYQNTVIVGFPTCPIIGELGLGDKLVTAAKASPEEQYRWLMLGEKYWLRGVDLEGQSLPEDTGNQISYTLKYDPKKTDYVSFAKVIRDFQSQVKCCSIMEQEDSSSHEYLPEQQVTKAEYESVCNQIQKTMNEDISFEHVDCASGACPVEFRK